MSGESAPIVPQAITLEALEASFESAVGGAWGEEARAYLAQAHEDYVADETPELGGADLGDVVVVGDDRQLDLVLVALVVGVDEQVGLDPSEAERVADVKVGFVVRGSAAERAARRQVVLPVRIEEGVAHRREGRAAEA